MTFLVITLISFNYPQYLFAQEDVPKWYQLASRTKTEKMFGMSQEANIRDFVWLKNGRMIIELNKVEDFRHLRNLDSLLMKLKEDIAFYKDSFANAGSANFTIDYALIDSFEFRQMRFTKHEPKGDQYVNKQGVTSKLKLEQDTIKILMHVRGNEPKMTGKMRYPVYRSQYTVQVILCLNNYSDIDQLIENREMLNHIMDTLQSTKKERTVYNPFKFPSSSRFIAYPSAGGRFSDYGGLAKADGKHPWNVSNRADNLSVVVNMGAGLTMNTITPYFEGGISLAFKHAFRDEKYFTELRAYMSANFLFDKNSTGGFYVRDNWFVNADFGAPDNIGAIKTRLLSWGAGYLVKQKGDYFKGTTMKLFVNIQFKHGITLCPEVISTNNFRQFFPGITLKVF